MTLGPDDPNLLYETGLALFLVAKYAEAESLYKQALALREEALDPEHPDVVSSLTDLAVLYRKDGRYVEAESPRSQNSLNFFL